MDINYSGLNVFVSMPFREEYEKVYKAILKSVDVVTNKLGVDINTIRVDEIKYPGNIVKDIFTSIEKSFIVIGDITDNNPNVLMEVGYAMALKKHVIFITQSIDNVPFNLKTYRLIKYDKEKLSLLINELSKYLIQIINYHREIISKINMIDFSEIIKYYSDKFNIIVVTGTMNSKNKSILSKTMFLKRFMDSNTIWLTGSYGVVDETVVKYLARHDQLVYVVGYNIYDLSEEMINILKNHRNLKFIDPYKMTGKFKNLKPKAFNSMTLRDFLFCEFSDFIILYWNGVSKNTKRLIDSCKKLRKDYTVLFID